MNRYMNLLNMKCTWLVLLFFAHAISSNLPGVQNSIYNELPWAIKVKLLNYQTTTEHTRRVGIQAFKMERVHDDNIETEETESKDESHMKLKLFRLMYETIRDSDLKIQRAEVIKKHYANSTVFSLGYIMGEVTERFTTMSDIAHMVRRMHDVWKPMEHITAYEHLANKAVEVSQLADAAARLAKRLN